MDAIKTGNFLRDLRKERNLTQEELGEQLGVTNKTISRWENGQYFPPVESLVQLGEIFNVTVNEILAGARLDSTNYQPKAEENIVATLKKSQKNNRGKKIAIVCCSIVLALVIALLSYLLVLSISSTKQKNPFVEGIYTNDEYKLYIIAIDEETYKSKNGVNVVEDKSVNRKNKYYEVTLYKLGKGNGDDIELTFEYLRMSTVTKAEPCYYTDIHGNSIGPNTSDNFVGYAINYNNETSFIVKSTK